MPQKRNVAPVEESVLEPVEEVKNVDPLLAARQAWLQHFEETYGRKPSAEEFLPLLKVRTSSFCRTCS